MNPSPLTPLQKATICAAYSDDSNLSDMLVACQFIMGCFAFMYYHNFIAQYNVTYADLLELAINGLSSHDQKELLKGLAQHLENQSILGHDVSCLSLLKTCLGI